MKYVITTKKKGSDPQRVAAAETAADALAIAQLISRSGRFEYCFAWRLWKGRTQYPVNDSDTPEQLRAKEAKMLGAAKLERAKRRFVDDHNALITAASAWDQMHHTPFGEALHRGNFPLAEEILHELLRRRLGFDALEVAAAA